MDTLKKVYEKHKSEIHLSLPTVKKYILSGAIKGVKVIDITKRKQYYVVNEEEFLTSFK